MTELRARDGDRVKAGDVLVRLDETVTRANLSIVSKDLDQLIAQKARLESERDGLEDVPMPAELASRMNDPQVASIMEGERQLFSLRRAARVGQKDQLSKRVDPVKEELTGYESQEKAKAREMELIKEQLVGARELYAKQLMPVTRFTELQRDAARLEDEHGVLIATMAQIKGKISETELQILDRLEQRYRQGDARS